MNNKENDPRNVMEETGENNKVFISRYDGVFQNADSIFIEYHDVIKSFQFWFIHVIRKSKAMNMYFDFSEIEDYDVEKLYEWYLHRRFQNVLYNIPIRVDKYKEVFDNDVEKYRKFCDDIICEYIDILPKLTTGSAYLTFPTVLQSLAASKMVNKFFIYTGSYLSKVIEDDVNSLLPDKSVKFLSGDIVDVLKDDDITSNSTFVFSDISKVEALKEAGKLNMSNILIASHYDYNFKEDNKDEPIIDIEGLLSECVFKLNFFENIIS